MEGGKASLGGSCQPVAALPRVPSRSSGLVAAGGSLPMTVPLRHPWDMAEGGLFPPAHGVCHLCPRGGKAAGLETCARGVSPSLYRRGLGVSPSSVCRQV